MLRLIDSECKYSLVAARVKPIHATHPHPHRHPHTHTHTHSSIMCQDEAGCERQGEIKRQALRLLLYSPLSSPVLGLSLSPSSAVAFISPRPSPLCPCQVSPSISLFLSRPPVLPPSAARHISNRAFCLPLSAHSVPSFMCLEVVMRRVIMPFQTVTGR